MLRADGLLIPVAFCIPHPSVDLSYPSHSQFDGVCLWVGLTARTNAAAVSELDRILSPRGITVVGLPVLDPEGKTLHLKVQIQSHTHYSGR